MSPRLPLKGQAEARHPYARTSSASRAAITFLAANLLKRRSSASVEEYTFEAGHPKTIGSPRIHPGSTPGSTLTSDVKELAVTWKCAPTNWPAQRTDLTSHRAVHRRTNPTERTTERAHEDRPTDRLVDGQTESRTDAFSHTHNLCCNDVGRSKPNCRSGYCLAPFSCPLSRR